MPYETAVDTVSVRTTTNGLSSHILPTSATMVAVCMAVISVVKITSSGTLGVWIDKLLGIDSMLFLASTLLSFVSLRPVRRAANLEKWAEWIFLAGLTILALASLVLSFEVF